MALTKTYTSAFSVEDIVVAQNNNMQFVGRINSITAIPGYNVEEQQVAEDYVTFQYVIRKTVNGTNIDITRMEDEIESTTAAKTRLNTSKAAIQTLIDEIDAALV